MGYRTKRKVQADYSRYWILPGTSPACNSLPLSRLAHGPMLPVSILNLCCVQEDFSGLVVAQDCLLLHKTRENPSLFWFMYPRYQCEIFQPRWSLIFVDTLLCRLFFSRSWFRWARFLIRFPICGGIRQDTAILNFVSLIKKSHWSPRREKEAFFRWSVHAVYPIRDNCQSLIHNSSFIFLQTPPNAPYAPQNSECICPPCFIAFQDQ